MKNTICFFNTAIPWGGGEKWHFEMAKHLHQNGHNVLIVCHKKSELLQRAIKDQLPYIAISNSNTSFLNPFKIFSFKNILKKHRVSTLILNLSQDVKSGGIAGKLAKVKRIIYRRGSAIPVRNTFLNRFFFKNVIDEILVNSKATQECILKNNSQLFPEDYIKIIPNGIDIKISNLKVQNPYYTRKNNELILTNLGRLEEQKNQLFLIDVAYELRLRGVKFHMVIGGSGRLEDSIKAKISALHLEELVQLVGFVKSPFELFDCGDIFLLPSLWEGFGYVVAEAGLSQKPTIAFDLSSNPEVIINNKTGILVPEQDLGAFCDAIEKFDTNRKLIDQMGNAAKEFVLDSFEKNKIHKVLEHYITSNRQQKISAIVTTYNEEKNIEKCLASIQWADEILVVDSFSTDNTVSMCKQFGATVLQREYNYASDQKNWAIPQAKNSWIVLLDADEVAEMSLESEVKSILHTRPKFTAYWMHRKNFFLGKEVKFCGWQHDRVVRFFHRDYHRYKNKRVHEEIEQNQKFGSLKSQLVHYTTQDLNLYTQKIERYAHYAAQELIEKKEHIGIFHLYIKPAFKFFQSYIIRGGILDGKIGWHICRLRTKETWLKAHIAYKHSHES